MTNLTEKQREIYEEFLIGFNFLLENLGQYMKEAGFYETDVLKNDLESLQKAEDFLFAVANKEIECDESFEEIKTWVSTYYGEVFIKVFGAGEWVQMDHEYLYNGYPAIDKWCRGESEIFNNVFGIVSRTIKKNLKGNLVGMIKEEIKDRENNYEIDFTGCVDDDKDYDQGKEDSIIRNGVLKVFRLGKVKLDEETLDELDRCKLAIKNKEADKVEWNLFGEVDQIVLDAIEDAGFTYKII